MCLLAFYSAPLTALAAVVRERCSARLHVPLAVLSGVNAALWVAYGVVRGRWGLEGQGGM